MSSGEIYILSRNTTHTLTRDVLRIVNFTYYNYIYIQVFMMKKDLNVSSAKELDGAKICVQSGTTTKLNMADYFRANGMKFTPVGYDTRCRREKASMAGVVTPSVRTSRSWQ